MNLLPRLFPLHLQLPVEVSDEILSFGEQLLAAGVCHLHLLLLFSFALLTGGPRRLCIPLADEENARSRRALLDFGGDHPQPTGDAGNLLGVALDLHHLVGPLLLSDSIIFVGTASIATFDACRTARWWGRGSVLFPVIGDGARARARVRVREEGGEEAGFGTEGNDEEVDDEVEVSGSEGRGQERGYNEE